MTTEAQARPQIHIRYEGRSVDIYQDQLDIGSLSADEQVRQAVAEHLGAPPTKLRNFVIDRHESGEMTLRPQAVFGGRPY
jgi:hypothetical protein